MPVEDALAICKPRTPPCVRSCPRVQSHTRVHNETRQLHVGVVATHSLAGVGQAAGRATVWWIVAKAGRQKRSRMNAQKA